LLSNEEMHAHQQQVTQVLISIIRKTLPIDVKSILITSHNLHESLWKLIQDFLCWAWQSFGRVLERWRSSCKCKLKKDEDPGLKDF